jgi:hypothetical protein
MTSFTWKRPEELEEVEPRVAPQDLEGRYAMKEDVDPESVKAWKRFVEELIEPVRALTILLEMTQGLARSPKQKRVFISHRMDAADWAERVAWLASTSAGLEYWLDVHDPVLRWATATLQPTDPRYAAAIAAIIEMALLNCTHVIALHTPPNPLPGNPRPSWIPSQWIPYEIGRAKSRKVFSDQMSGWFHPQVRPPELRGEYVLLADRRFSDADVEKWLISKGTDARNNQAAQATYLGKGKQIPPASLP